MIDTVRNTVLAILNKNNYGYLSPSDFNLYAQQAQLEIFEDYFYQYNTQLNLENARRSGTDYANLSKGILEVIDLFSKTAPLVQLAANTYTMPSDSISHDRYEDLLSQGQAKIIDDTSNELGDLNGKG